MPRANVCANPFTVPGPSSRSTPAAIKVVTLPSTIADNALSNPLFIALLTLFPSASSSLIRAKIITFASTAIPMDRIMPATPDNVNVISKPFSNKITNATYANKPMADATPGTRYTTIINTITMPRPIAPAFKLVSMASTPSCAPTTLECSSSSSS